MLEVPSFLKLQLLIGSSFLMSNSFWIRFRQPELYEDSPGSSEYSTGSTLLPHSAGNNSEHSLHPDIGTEKKSTEIENIIGASDCDKQIMDQGKLILSQ